MDIAQLGNALTETSKVRVGHVMLCGVQCLPKLATSAKDAGELRLGHVTELANFGYTSVQEDACLTNCYHAYYSTSILESVIRDARNRGKVSHASVACAFSRA